MLSSTARSNVRWTSGAVDEPDGAVRILEHDPVQDVLAVVVEDPDDLADLLAIGAVDRRSTGNRR